jgi:hypothetical protein
VLQAQSVYAEVAPRLRASRVHGPVHSEGAARAVEDVVDAAGAAASSGAASSTAHTTVVGLPADASAAAQGLQFVGWAPEGSARAAEARQLERDIRDIWPADFQLTQVIYRRAALLIGQMHAGAHKGDCWVRACVRACVRVPHACPRRR